METYVVRVWRASDATGTAGLRGTVRRTDTGDETPFRRAEELVAFLERPLAAGPHAGPVPGRRLEHDEGDGHGDAGH